VAFDLPLHLRQLEADGWTVIPDFLDAATLAEVRRVLAFYLGTHRGRNDFEGTRTERDIQVALKLRSVDRDRYGNVVLFRGNDVGHGPATFAP